MPFSKPIKYKNGTLGSGKEPVICTPLVGTDEPELCRELDIVLARKPDLIEWRVDFFTGIADQERVVALARAIRERAGSIPLLFTRRSVREGGNPIPLDETQVFSLYAAVCRSGCADLFDYELGAGETHFRQAVALAAETGVRLLASYHDFQETPDAGTLLAKLTAMQEAGADIAKIAVMPRSLRDVLTLLDATLKAHETLSVPVITMSMGGHGSLSRLFGWAFGSSVSFAVGEKASAPGQIPVEDLKTVIEIMHRALKGP